MARIGTPAEPPIAVQGLQAVVNTQRDKIAKLQKFADDAGRRWLSGLYTAVTNVEDAQAVSETYDEAWFASQVYSDAVKREIAKTLLAACAPYPTVDVSAWTKIAEVE